MCSPDPAEIEAVKGEFFKAGILAETRNNPVAEALGIGGVELWVMDEQDFFTASKLYADLRARTSWKCGGAAAYPQAEAPDPSIGLAEPEAGNGDRPNRGVNSSNSRHVSEPEREELEQASSLLEKEIDEMLKRESESVAECASLRSKMKELGQALAEGQAAFARETESRAAAEREQAEKLSALQSALECERAKRARAEEQAGVAAEAQKLLEKQLLDQKDLEQRVQAHVASINSLDSKLQAKRAARV